MGNYVGHKKIHRFYFDGSIHDEADIPRLKNQYEKLLGDYLRSKGYVRIFDIDPVFTIEYNGKNFNFTISLYAYYVGKAKARCCEGITSNKIIPMTSIQRNKSDQSSIPAEWS
jgi:hypothetical protein